MAHSIPSFILSLLLIATISNACRTCEFPPPPPPEPKPTPCPPPPVTPETPPQPKPKPTPSPPAPVTPATPPPATCPRDTLKLGACGGLLGGAVSIVIGTSSPCCQCLEGLSDSEVALCLCTAIKANVLGIIHVDIEVALSTIVSTCDKSIPSGFQCG